MSMRIKSPYLTLAGAFIGFAALLVTNLIVAPRGAAGNEYRTKPPSTATAATPASSPSLAASSPRPSSSTPSPSQKSPKPSQTPALAQKAVYAGHTQKGGPAVAVAVLHNRAAAYLCDGRTSEAWLTGSAVNGGVSLKGKHGSTLTAHLADNGRLAGTLTVNGSTYAFHILPAHRPAGIYRARTDRSGKQTTIGWIVLPDGSQVGIRNVAGAVSPAPMLHPGGDLFVSGQRLNPKLIQGDESSL
jgi:hypothetical protein